MKLKLITLLTGTTLFLSSCLKDKGYQDLRDDNGAIPVVEIKEATETDAVILSLDVTPPLEDVLAFEIRMSSRGASNTAHTIKLALDPAAVTAYDPALVAPTATQIQVPSLDVIIPAGSMTAKLLIKVNKPNLDLANAYGLGFKIVDGGGAVISENSKSIVVAVGVKNQYDATYVSTGVRLNFNAASDPLPAATLPWTFDTHIFTVSATTCKVHVGNSDGGLGYFNITVNPDNTVTIASTGETGVANLVATPSTTSTYTPATKTFNLFYQWTNASGTFRKITDKLVRK
jgi:Domain of unknown function (DUF4361)/Domain of unknown function (DUF1735)